MKRALLTMIAALSFSFVSPQIASANIDCNYPVTAHSWTGNVRELQNSIERAVILSPGPQIEAEDLKLQMGEGLNIEKVDLARFPQADAQVSLRDEIRGAEVKALSEALRKAGGNISEAARLLGVARSTLFHRLKKFHLI